MEPMDAIRQQAAEWLIHLDGKHQTDPVLDPDFRDWLARDPRHGQVFDQMRRLWTGATPAASPARLGRALGVAGICLAIAVAGTQMPWQVWGADYKTGVGKVVSIDLPDGSEITLNTGSAINVHVSQHQRQIELLRGEVLLDVKTDRQHPFVVITRHGSAEALGTRYTVRQNDDHSRVTVYESRVRVSLPDHDPSVVLATGQWARMDATGIQAGAGALPASPDWSRNQLVFNGATLPEVIDRLEMYHTGTIMLSDALTHSSKRFTGALPASDSDAALRLLAASLTLDLGGLPPYFVYLDDSQ